MKDHERKYLDAIDEINKLTRECGRLKAELAKMTGHAKANCKTANLHMQDSQERWLEIQQLIHAIKLIRSQVTLPPDLDARLAARWHELYE